MADNWWESDAVVGQPSAPSTPRVMTVGTPRPEKPNIPSGRGVPTVMTRGVEGADG